jgi:predicted  nucleic acid-binding Zn-ribbon protein
MSSPLSLYRLQQVDSQIDRILVRLDVIKQKLEDDGELRIANKLLSAVEATNNESSKVLYRLQAEVDGLHNKMEQSEGNLYSGNVQNPKELQELQNDIAAQKRFLLMLEDRLLEAMIKNEETVKDLKDAQLSTQTVREQLINQSHNLKEEQNNLNQDLARLTAERQAIICELEVESIDLYEKLRRVRRGIAVSNVAEGTCSACGTTLTPSQLQSARSVSQITLCPSCRRVIYAG